MRQTVFYVKVNSEWEGLHENVLYSALCLVRRSVQVALVHGGMWKNFPLFLREGGLWYLSLLASDGLGPFFLPHFGPFFGLSPPGRRVPRGSPRWPTAVGCLGLGVVGTPGV